MNYYETEGLINLNSPFKYNYPDKYYVSFIIINNTKKSSFIGSNAFGVKANIDLTSGQQTIILPFSLKGLDDFKVIQGDYKIKHEYTYAVSSSFNIYLPPNIGKKLKKNGITARIYFSFDFNLFNIITSYLYNDATLYNSNSFEVTQKLIGARLDYISFYDTKNMSLLTKVKFN